ncbi:MAG: PTS sugar transporter subunit IIB [Proteobacteria bacterium]|nr:PTS sugar transporter subunit IIB [Pseudomonadota bacterium]
MASQVRKRIIVACGSGVASSTLVANRLMELLPKHGLKNIQVDVVDFKDAKGHSEHADLFVNISPYGDTKYGCPVVSGVPFMIGFGMEGPMEEIKKVLNVSGK